MNLYAYAGNNPASYSDPFGLMICCPQDKKGDAAKRAIAQTMFASGLPQPIEPGPRPADVGALQSTLADPSAFLGPAELKVSAVLLLGLTRRAAETGIQHIVAGLTERYGAPVVEAAGKRLEFNIAEDGTKMVVRGPETHPIPGSGGQPVTHYNVEVHSPAREPGRFRITERAHLDESGRVLDP